MFFFFSIQLPKGNTLLKLSAILSKAETSIPHSKLFIKYRGSFNHFGLFLTMSVECWNPQMGSMA